MSIWADIHRRSNGLQARREDTVQDDLEYFRSKMVKNLKIPGNWVDDFSNIDIQKVLKI